MLAQSGIEYKDSRGGEPLGKAPGGVTAGGFFDFACEECVAGENAFDYDVAVCCVVAFGCHGLPPLVVVLCSSCLGYLIFVMISNRCSICGVLCSIGVGCGVLSLRR